MKMRRGLYEASVVSRAMCRTMELESLRLPYLGLPLPSRSQSTLTR